MLRNINKVVRFSQLIKNISASFAQQGKQNANPP